jgi:hypothetical protein
VAGDGLLTDVLSLRLIPTMVGVDSVAAISLLLITVETDSFYYYYFYYSLFTSFHFAMEVNSIHKTHSLGSFHTNLCLLLLSGPSTPHKKPEIRK